MKSQLSLLCLRSAVHCDLLGVCLWPRHVCVCEQLSQSLYVMRNRLHRLKTFPIDTDT